MQIEKKIFLIFPQVKLNLKNNLKDEIDLHLNFFKKGKKIVISLVFLYISSHLTSFRLERQLSAF